MSNKKSRYEFRFNICDKDSVLEKNANLKLAQLLAHSPPGATAVGLIEKSENHYVSAIEVQSPYRTFFEKAAGLTPQSAIKLALEKIENRIYQWRYGGGESNGHARVTHFTNSAQTRG